MKVKDLTKLIKCSYLIEGSNDVFDSIQTVPDKIMNAEVASLEVKDGKIIISIDELKNIKSLEDLGYSFEAGV